MNLGGIAKTTLLDFPGRLACVLFTQGCTYDCFYCHNRELIGFGEGPVLFSEALSFLEKRVGLLEGVVFSGGEPTLQKDLISSIQMVHALGFAIKLDTNGCSPSLLATLLDLDLLSYVALDVKAPSVRYREICGQHADPDTVRQSLSLLARKKEDFPSFMYEVRTTLAPTIGKEDLISIAQAMPVVPLWRINSYRKPPLYKEEDAFRIHAGQPLQAEVDSWKQELKLLQPNLIL
ncbi:anaerobic ribonucleoside-triphosphate reductase activating protein [Sphaerochaeta sp. PS]|uniref:anaerobic ribonucleoside-triphosphate reductase activating protein n=1 Tax=Sphaerochaeta sp. PS TaxID=3076336 RepID=UPI0028A32FB5|nr:anaerobic ribonucleoside-triphosphate reductase activating protein [Sphaerochaeta sp. PS]MDT4762461.1 anaerobic ribonucleoside-triphosphate reductase activating protein [Sphaerochaeta sp. PS]